MSPRRSGSSGASGRGRQEWWPESAPRRPGSGPWRAAGRRPFGATWWGAAWVEALEQRARLDANRLPRGRTYARTGAVIGLELVPGEIRAQVQGSRARPYDVVVRVRQFSDAEWEQTLDVLASQAGHLAALLDCELPPAVAVLLAEAGLDLLPVAGEVQPRCSCPDWADPCKHSAATCYLVADELDEDPFGIFKLRGRARDQLLAALRARRSAGAAAAGGAAGPGGPGAAAGGGIVAPGHDDWDRADEGTAAREVWARWAALRAVGGGRDPDADAGAREPDHARGGPAAQRGPDLPLPPARPGRPTVLAVDPPEGCGISIDDLRRLAADAASRALELATGGRETGLDLSLEEDVARRAAASLTAVSPEFGTGELGRIAQRTGIPVRALLRRALAWQAGGREGLFALTSSWDPPRADVEAARSAVAASAGGMRARVRRNRLTAGERQLRIGRDGRWYPYRIVRGTWEPDGEPTEP